MPLTVSTFAQLKALQASRYSAVAAMPANTDKGSTTGSIFDAASLMGLTIQSEINYVNLIARLASIPAMPDGSPNPDVDSFCEPFGVKRLGPTAASGVETFTAPSPVGSPLVIPKGGQVATETGLVFTLDDDVTMLTGNTTVDGAITCTTPGIIGNVGIDTINQIQNGAGIPTITGINSVTNAAAFTNGEDFESDAQYKVRFTLQVSTGVVATANAIMAAAAAVEAGLTFSFGDRKNLDGTLHTAFFTLVVNLLGHAAGPGSSLLSAVTTAVEKTRSAGISYAVTGPTLVPVNGAATITVDPTAGFTEEEVQTAVTAAYVDYLNNIGLDSEGGTTEADYFTVGCVLTSVPGVKKIDSLTLNSGTSDVVAVFGEQIVAGTTNFVTA